MRIERFELISSHVIFINNKPYIEYKIRSCTTGKIFVTLPEITEMYLGVYKDMGTVGKYYKSNSYGMLTSYFDCRVYVLSNGDIAEIQLDDDVIWKNDKFS